MLLQKYLQTIEKINPNKIYVENVRSFFKVPNFIAKLMCEMAVVDRVFTKKYGVVCPNDSCRRVISSYESLDQIPTVINCEICEEDDESQHEFTTSNMEIIEFYQLNKSK